MKDAIQQGVVTEVQPEVTTVGGKGTKTNGTGDLIMDIAHEVENLSKAKAHSEATRLADDIEINYLRLGGILKLIRDHSWFGEGFASFEQFVYEQFGYTSRKANYVIQIYDNLVTKQIPWGKVAHLGWTKLKFLAPILTLENVDEWVAKAEKLGRLELQALLKATGNGKETTVTATSEVLRFSVKLKPDQLETVTQGIAKAKGEMHTEYDSVALEAIMSGYIGGTVQSAGDYNLDTVIKNTGFEPILMRIAELFPEYDINVTPATVTS